MEAAGPVHRFYLRIRAKKGVYDCTMMVPVMDG
jgi:hypothetical protein